MAIRRRYVFANWRSCTESRVRLNFTNGAWSAFRSASVAPRGPQGEKVPGTAASICSNVREQKWVYFITSSARPISIVGRFEPERPRGHEMRRTALIGVQMRKISQLSAECHLLSFEDGNAMNRLAAEASAIGSNRKGLTVS